MLHSISDLTTFCRKTTGDVPAKLVGASTTVVGSKMYLFGGRLVSERRMVSDLYVFDMETFVWEKLPSFPEDDVPRARYFHSADTWNNQLIIFGGMSNRLSSPNPDDLCVLNDVRFFDLSSRHWLPASLSNGVLSDTGPESLVPRARYAHLASITADRLFIIGGQDFDNVWLDDICVYDLVAKAWVQRRNHARRCGTYRGVAISSNMCVRFPEEEREASQSVATLGPPGARFREDKIPPPSSEFTGTSPDSLNRLPYSTLPTEDHPSDIYLYSNYNFTDVKRELEVISPLPESGFTVQDRSTAMSGASFPPGLRFPSGAVLGTHFIIAGTYLAHTYQSYSIWALDLQSLTWSRIDPGSAVATGSWFRGCLWAEMSKFLIFGNRNGNLVDDYNRRLLSWDHVAVVDLEAFGIYQPPMLRLNNRMQELGLAALEEKVLTDFEIICDDKRKIACSRKILEERWPWFKDQLKKYNQLAYHTLETLPNSPMHVGLPELPGVVSANDPRPDPRLTPRSFHLSEPYPITLALLQYFYSLALLTPLQQAPAVLSQLLVLSTTYKITHLESLVKHSMHRALSNSTSVGVYEVATLCSCRSLQIRALKTVMSYSQKRPSRSRSEKDNGNGDRNPDQNGGGGSRGVGGKPGEAPYTRPRGTSDAHWRSGTESGSSSNRGYPQRTNVASSDGRPVFLPIVEEGSTPTDAYYQPSSPPSKKRPALHHRAVSNVSVSTDREICAVAELMSPSILDSRKPFNEDAGTEPAIDDSFDNLLEPYLFQESEEPERPDTPELISRPISRLDFREISSAPTSPLAKARSRSSELLRSGSFSDFAYSPASPSSKATSTSSESEFDFPDDHSSFTPTAYVAFHLPRPRTRTVYTGASDSDTPSLASTSFSSLASTSRSQHHRISPLTPVSASTEYGSGGPPHLAMIEELHPEDYIPGRLQRDPVESPSAITIVPRESDGISWPKQKPSSPEPIISSSPSRSSGTMSPSQSPKTATNMRMGNPVSISRFLSSSKKDKDAQKIQAKLDRSDKTASKASFDSGFVSSTHPIDAKALKADEKKRKKAEAKAKIEQLALDLKARAKERAAAAEATSVHSGSGKSGKSNGVPREEVAMYGGIPTGLTM